LALEWGRIDFEARRISVTQNLSYGAIGTTKGGRGRTIPLVNQLETLLRAYRPSQGGGLVFPGEVKYLDPSTLRRRYATDVRRAGLRHLPMHSLRHYFASTAVNVASLVQVGTGWDTPTCGLLPASYLHSKSLVSDADTLGAGF
jgi:integrase